MNFINDAAKGWFEKLHTCYMQKKDKSDCATVAGARPFVISSGRDYIPAWYSKLPKTKYRTKGGGGVLWYRGYSGGNYGAGSDDSCKDAVDVGKMFGFEAMAIAHTTHKTITQYCAKTDDLPIFAVDTHYKTCAENEECDFESVVNSKAFHDDAIDFDASNVPQALKVERYTDGAVKYEACLIMLNENSVDPTIECQCLHGSCT